MVQRGEGHPSRSTKKLVANVPHDEAPKVPWEHVSLFTKNSKWISEVWGDMVHECDKQIEKSARRRQIHEVGQIFVTNLAFMLTSWSVAHTHPRDDSSAYPKGIMNNDTQIGPVLHVLVTLHFDRYGIEIMFDSMVNDVTEFLLSSTKALKSTSQSLLWTTRSQCTMMKSSEAQIGLSR